MNSESLDSASEEEEEQDQFRSLLRKKNMEARSEHQTKRRYELLYGITTTVGVFLIACILFWCLHFRGGFAWSSDPALEFNWHPLLMVTSLIFFFGQSILIYRTGRNKQKKILKLSHASIHALSFIFAVIGLKAVFDSHNLKKDPTPNLYTLHSWVGLATVILFTGQFVAGIVTFLYPMLSKSLRATILPVHVHSGTALFIFALISAMTGIQEKAIYTLLVSGDKRFEKNDYQARVPEAYMINFIGFILALFGILTVYLVTDITYKRISLPEDEIDLTGNTE